MNLKIVLFLFGAFLMSATNINAQSNDVGSWWMYFGYNRVHDKWSIYTETQYRSHDHGQEIEQLLLRTGLNFHYSKNSWLALGYAHVTSYDLSQEIGSPTTTEHRIWQQYIHKHIVPRIAFEHRFRVEERWIENIYKSRLRYRLFLSIPLNTKYIEPGTWMIGIYDELFLNTVESYFDRNRFYIALGRQMNHSLNIQAGMMNQMTSVKDKWYFQLSLLWNPDLRKVETKSSSE